MGVAKYGVKFFLLISNTSGSGTEEFDPRPCALNNLRVLPEFRHSSVTRDAARPRGCDPVSVFS
jgi:hypothetical protein